MKRYQRFIGLLLAMVMTLLAAPLSVSAASVYEGGERRGKNGGDIRVEGDWTAGFSASEASPFSIHTIAPEYENSIYLTDADIDLADRDFVNFLALEPGAEVSLHLSGVNRITAGTGRAGITVPKGAKLSILGSGSLTVTGGDGGAGIGGDKGMTGGDVVIGDQIEFLYSFARVNANGGADAAGIGGGSGANGGGVTIWGGLVTAAGGGTAQDIGAGAGGVPGSTWLYGGRLVNYDKIGWRPDDSAARQEVRVQVDGMSEILQMSIDAITSEANTVFTTVIPQPAGGWESDIAYLYIPTRFTDVKLNLAPSKISGEPDFRHMAVTQPIPENGRLRVYFTGE